MNEIQKELARNPERIAALRAALASAFDRRAQFTNFNLHYSMAKENFHRALAWMNSTEQFKDQRARDSISSAEAYLARLEVR